MTDGIRHAIDHNRGLAGPIRMAHLVLAPITEWMRWLRRPRYRYTLLPIVLGVLGAAALFPFDGALGGWINGLDDRSADGGRLLGGDVVRELAALQQFGGLSSVLIVALAVWLLDPARRERVWDLLLATGVTSAAAWIAKLLIGRPRPKFEDPGLILGPFAAYPIGPGEGVHHAWEFWSGISSDLWSMPSSHTSAATALAVFIGLLYPVLRWPLVVWVSLVAFSRVLFGAHWPSDLALGAGLGFATSSWVVRQELGRRAARSVGLLRASDAPPSRGG